MIFAHTFDKVEHGIKTVTRRLWRPDWELTDGRLTTGRGWRRELYRVGGTYAAQPGRGKPAEFRIEILSLREENLQDITEGESIMEGIGQPTRNHPAGNVSHLHVNFAVRCGDKSWAVGETARDAYCSLWNTIHQASGCQWDANPRVVRIEFRKLEAPHA
ncbi:hypothetical protein [Armatimonas sp.]|uniref:hypothetical protein n=1 Tax=Armatimonas sp. TaxID=1872638 RepID=UPI0037502792